jgi:hypothetical protein
MKIDDLELLAKDALLECIQEIPFLEDIEVCRELSSDGGRVSIHVVVHSNGEVRSVIAEVKNNGEPRFARQAANQLLRNLREARSDYGVFIAPYISPRAASICEKEGIGYVDLAGNCHISFDSIYIHKEGKSNPFNTKRRLRSLYSPKAERILRVMLSSWPREWKTKELADEADVSLGLVSNVKKLLNDQEWIDSKAVGFSLNDPFLLLEDWSRSYRFRRSTVLSFYSMLSPTEYEGKLAEVCQQADIRYGLTGFSGSDRYAPAVRYQRVMAYVENGIEEIGKLSGIKPVDSGANVMLLQPYDEGVFYGIRQQGNCAVVSPIQTYLDLRSYRGRGEEAAKVLLEQVIQKTW